VFAAAVFLLCTALGAAPDRAPEFVSPEVFVNWSDPRQIGMIARMASPVYASMSAVGFMILARAGVPDAIRFAEKQLLALPEESDGEEELSEPEGLASFADRVGRGIDAVRLFSEFIGVELPEKTSELTKHLTAMLLPVGGDT
jgi:hypothetical protein